MGNFGAAYREQQFLKIIIIIIIKVSTLKG